MKNKHAKDSESHQSDTKKIEKLPDESMPFYLRYNGSVHYAAIAAAVLVVLLLILGIYNYGQFSRATIANTYVRVDGDDVNCDGSVNAPYPGSGGPGLNCAVKTLDQGILLVDPGGNVYVGGGTYNITNVYVTKPLLMQSIDGIGAAKIVTSENNGALQINAVSNVIIDGFDISGPSTPPGGEPFGIFINDNSNIRITNCWLHDIAPGYPDPSPGNGGIVIGNEGATNVEIDHNKFYNFYNTSPTVKSYGINMNSNTVTDNINIHDNEFYDIYSPGNDDAGIRVSAQKANLNLTIQNNSFNNVGDRAIWLRRVHTNTKLIRGNTMAGGSSGATGAGIEIKGSPDNITGNTISGYQKCIYINDSAALAPTIQNNNLSCIEKGIEIGASVSASTNITNNSITGNQYGIVANIGSTAPVINNNKICNTIKNITNLAAGIIDATNNYFCTTDNTATGSMIDGPVDYRPFYINESETILCPGILEVSSTTADGTYGSGAVITITIKYSESVSVTGIPKIKLNVGPNVRYAEYSSGSGSDTLSFTYSIQSGDSADPLDYDSENALELNGGTITSSLDGLSGSLTLPAKGTFTNSHKIIISTAVPSPTPTPTVTTTTTAAPSPSAAEATPAVTPTPAGEEAASNCPEVAETDCLKCFCRFIWILILILICAGIGYYVYYILKNNSEKKHHHKDK